MGMKSSFCRLRWMLDFNQWSDSIDIFGDYDPPASPLASQASSLAQSSPEEPARWAAALPPGKEQDDDTSVIYRTSLAPRE